MAGFRSFTTAVTVATAVSAFIEPAMAEQNFGIGLSGNSPVAVVVKVPTPWLDEPSMGLSPILVDQVFEKVQAIAAAGTTILLVEQNARMALEIASLGLVLESGQLTLQGSGEELLKSAQVRAAYLGEE